MNTQQKPIVIDIEVRKVSPARSPPIAQKLMKQKQEQAAEPPLSMEDIKLKIS